MLESLNLIEALKQFFVLNGVVYLLKIKKIVCSMSILLVKWPFLSQMEHVMSSFKRLDDDWTHLK